MSCILNFLNQNSGAIQAVMAGALVWLTFKMASESEKSRKDTRMPELKVELSGPVINGGKKYLSFKIINNGRGAAFNIRGIFQGRELRFNNLDVGECDHVELYLEEKEIETISKLSIVDKIFTINYADIFSREISVMVMFGDTNRGDFIEFETKNWSVDLP